MKQADRKAIKAGAMTRQDQVFDLSGVTVVIPAGQPQSACLFTAGVLLDEALDGLIKVGMQNLTAGDDPGNAVWSAIHLLEVAKAMNQAAQSANPH